LPLSFAVLSTNVQVRAEEEGQDILEEGAEDRLQMRVPVLCRLFRGRQGEAEEVHRLAAEVQLCLVRLVRQVAEAILRLP
jgi:hypothetical protein